jgi:RNA-splicing ligase RtcB
MRKSLGDVPDSVADYMGDDWKPLADKIREDFEGSDIQNKFDEVSQAIQQYGPSTADRNTDLDYLKGEEAHGYIKDMIFAQTYASESRREMGFAVAKALASVTGSEQEHLYKVGDVESVHNYIDFEDATIRKGACRAQKEERLIVPFNMKYGTIIARGKGEDAWNESSAHGAGRAMSRTAARNQFTDSDFAEQTEGVYMSKKPMDEIPGAYKTPEDIEAALGGNVEVENRITPFLSIKAE